MGIDSPQCERLGILDESPCVHRFAARAGERALTLVEVRNGLTVDDPRLASIMGEPVLPDGLIGIAGVHELEEGGVSLVLSSLPTASLLGEVSFQSASEVLDALDAPLEALAWCHARGLVHGGLGPQELYLDQNSDPARLRLAFAGLGPPGDPREDVAAFANLTRTLLAGHKCHKDLTSVLESASSGELARRPSNASVLRALLKVSRRFATSEKPKANKVRRTPPRVKAVAKAPKTPSPTPGAPSVAPPPAPERPPRRRKWASQWRVAKLLGLVVLIAGVLSLLSLAPGWWDAQVPSCERDEDCRAGHCSNTKCAPEGFVYLPPGRVSVGVDRFADSGVGLYIQATEVSQSQWAAVAGTRPAWFKNCGGQCPVESVNFYEVLEYINALSVRDGLEACYNLTACRGASGTGCTEVDDKSQGGHYCRGQRTCREVAYKGPDCRGYRLPSGPEWDFAAMAPKGVVSSWTGGKAEHWTLGVGEAGFEGGYPCGLLDPTQAEGALCGPQGVGKVAPNQWAIHNIIGNVQEWVEEPIDDEMEVDAEGFYPVEKRRSTMRGGAWAHKIGQVNPSFVSRADYDQRFLDIGFRVALTASRESLVRIHEASEGE